MLPPFSTNSTESNLFSTFMDSMDSKEITVRTGKTPAQNGLREHNQHYSLSASLIVPDSAAARQPVCCPTRGRAHRFLRCLLSIPVRIRKGSPPWRKAATAGGISTNHATAHTAVLSIPAFLTLDHLIPIGSDDDVMAGPDCSRIGDNTKTSCHFPAQARESRHPQKRDT
jgi:hypothetical protein